MNNTKSFQIKIADRIIKINSMHDYIKNYCKDYIIDNKLPYDFEITTTQKAIDYEREKSRKQCEAENIDVSIYSDSYLETLSIYRQIHPQSNKICLKGVFAGPGKRGNPLVAGLKIYATS